MKGKTLNVLHDPNTTHYFISNNFVKRLDLTTFFLPTHLIVSTPTNKFFINVMSTLIVLFSMKIRNSL